MIEGNFFAFNSKKDILDLYRSKDPENEWRYIEGKRKPGTLISPTLKKYYSKNFEECKDYKYVIAYSRFNGPCTYKYTLDWPKKFTGKKLIFNDTSDKIFCYPTYLFFSKIFSWVYLKKNLSFNDEYKRWRQKRNRQDWPLFDDLLMNEPEESYVKVSYSDLFKSSLNKVLFPGPESPPAGNIKAVLDYSIEWKDFKDREYDVFFAGQSRAGYMVGNKTESIKKLKETVKKLKLKALILDKRQNIGREGYMRAISNTKFCYNFSIGPLRNRREWEILLGGGLLVQDRREVTMEKDIMQVGKHYILQNENMEEQLQCLIDHSEQYETIAKQGYDLARISYCSIPTLEFRLMFCYLLDSSKRIRTIEDLKKQESKLKLR